MNSLPQDSQDTSSLDQTSTSLSGAIYPGDSFIDKEMPDKAQEILALTLEKDMILFSLGVAIDIKNMLSQDNKANEDELISLITGVVSFMHPQLAANDAAYGLRCEEAISEGVNICRRIVHDMLHAARRYDPKNTYLNAELVSKWAIFERSAKAIRQKDIVPASEIEDAVDEPTDLRIKRWLKGKKIQFKSENLDPREMDIMTGHVQFRTKEMLAKYNDLNAEDKELVDALYEIHANLVELYNELHIERDYAKPENEYMIAESIGLTPQEADNMVWPNKLSGLIADIEDVIRKMLMPANYDTAAIYNRREDII